MLTRLDDILLCCGTTTESDAPCKGPASNVNYFHHAMEQCKSPWWVMLVQRGESNPGVDTSVLLM